MSEVMFLSGSMFGRKSKVLIDFINISKKDNMTKYLVFKPANDTRDGLYVKSRDYVEKVPAIAWTDTPDMQNLFEYIITGFVEHNLFVNRKVFFDEAHFLSFIDMDFIVETCRKYQVDLYMSGLETSYKFEKFESTAYLKQIADNYVFFHGKCRACGEMNAVYNIRLDGQGKLIKDGETLVPGDSETYDVVCEECFKTLE